MAHAWAMKETIRAYTIAQDERDDHGAVRRYVLTPIVVDEITEFPAMFHAPSQTETLTRTGLVYRDQEIMSIAHPAQVFAGVEFVERLTPAGSIWYRVIGRSRRSLVGKIWGWEITIERHEGETPDISGG